MMTTWLNKIIPLAFFISIAAQAETLESRLEKMKAIVAKDGRCEFGVVSIPTGEHKNAVAYWPKTIDCIGDVVMDEGTMNERSGCAYFSFDPYKGNANSSRFGKIAEGKSCSKDGFEAVMTMDRKVYASPDYKPDPSGVSVDEIGWNFYGSILFLEPMILYNKTSSAKYEDWFKKKRVIWIAQEKDKAAKKEQAEKIEREREVAVEKKAQEKEAKKNKKKKEVEALWK